MHENKNNYQLVCYFLQFTVLFSRIEDEEVYFR